MKKLFLLSSAVLFAASCTNEIIENAPASNNEAKGISFTLVENDETRGMVTEDYTSFFYAELDRVGIYADNAKAYKGGAALNGFSEVMEYKATKSKGNPYLTGINDDNIISYKDTYAANESAGFFVVYPSNTTTTYNTADGGQFTIDATDLTTQNVSSDGTMNFDKRLMYDFVGGKKPEKSYNSVGETLELNLVSPYAMLWYAFTDIEDYTAFGKLQSITLTNNGAEYVKDGNKKTTESSPVAVESGKFTVDKNDAVKSRSLTTGNSITLNVGQEVKNNQKFNMFVNTKDATYKDGSNTYTKTDKYNITYVFEDVDLIYTKKTSSAAWKANAVYSMPNAKGMTIADEYAYILTRGTAGNNDRVLYVNKGTVASIMKDNKIQWTDSRQADGKVDPKEITEVIINAGATALNDADWNAIAKMENLSKLTIKNATTEVPAETIKGLALTYVNLQNVTKIHETSFAASKLETVIMPKFNFAASKTITRATLKEAYLKVLDMSGTTSIKDDFPYEGMSLSGYTLLTDVTVYPGLIAGPESFKGCTALTNVTGYVTLSGYGIFEGCTSLESVSIDESTEIYEFTFNGATNLENVYQKDGKTAIQPTTIGIQAFRGTNANIDLTKTVTIGQSAFFENTALMGTETYTGSGKYLLIVNASTVGKYAFQSTPVQYVRFDNLTTVENGILNKTVMSELKFANVVSFAKDVDDKVFGSSTENTKLFVQKGQETVGNKLKANNKEITFSTIIKE